MSNYKRLTRHPNTGNYHNAEWKDNYFGQHLYGVKFPNDEVVYPAEQVTQAQLKEFWADDVISAVADFIIINPELHGMSAIEAQLSFLYILNKVYKERWKRDPTGGEGAIKRRYGEFVTK